jgi:Spy/CpxP family protein refolding chaperone
MKSVSVALILATLILAVPGVACAAAQATQAPAPPAEDPWNFEEEEEPVETWQ